MNKKEKKNIFEGLFEKNVCFAICAFSSYCINKELELCTTDYIVIINQCDVELVENEFTFYQTEDYKQVFERKLSRVDVKVLKKYQDSFVKVKHDKYGRVYELKGNSFKTSFDNNKRQICNNLIERSFE